MFHLFLDPLTRVTLSRLCRRCGALIPENDRFGHTEGICAACRVGKD